MQKKNVLGNSQSETKEEDLHGEMEPSNKWEYAELLLDMEIEFCTMAEQLIKEYIDATSGKTPIHEDNSGIQQAQ